MSVSPVHERYLRNALDTDHIDVKDIVPTRFLQEKTMFSSLKEMEANLPSFPESYKFPWDHFEAYSNYLKSRMTFPFESIYHETCEKLSAVNDDLDRVLISLFKASFAKVNQYSSQVNISCDYLSEIEGFDQFASRFLSDVNLKKEDWESFGNRYYVDYCPDIDFSKKTFPYYVQYKMTCPDDPFECNAKTIARFKNYPRLADHVVEKYGDMSKIMPCFSFSLSWKKEEPVSEDDPLFQEVLPSHIATLKRSREYNALSEVLLGRIQSVCGQVFGEIEDIG